MGLSILVGEDGKDLPTSFIRHCSENQTLDERTMTYYDETIQTSARRILPLLSYFHQDSRPDKFGGTSLQEFSHIWEMQFQI